MSMNPNCQKCGEEDAEVVLCTACVKARISAAVAEEREQIAKYVFATMEHGQVSLDDGVAAIRSRGSQKGEPS